MSVENGIISNIFSAEKDTVTSEYYEKPVAVGDFYKHCAQRRKYPVLLKIEFNNAVKEKDGHNTLRHGAKKVNQEKNQNPRILPCKPNFSYELGPSFFT